MRCAPPKRSNAFSVVSGFSGGFRINSRIGIASGEILAGYVGSRARASYTVHGATVNLAARLEELNKQVGTQILSSRTTMQLSSPDPEFRGVGAALIRGKRHPCMVYEPL